MKNARCFSRHLLPVLLLCLAALPGLAQAPGGRFGQRTLATRQRAQVNGLARLNHALQVAGAPVLSSTQETALKSLVDNFRAAHTTPAPNTNVQSARAALDAAILNQQFDAASAQIIAGEAATSTAARLKERADFAISVIQALDKGQVDALAKQFGADRTVQLIESLALPGPGARGAGMGMYRPVR
jgi:hypothetical protein